jgi:hypothetical protein
MKILILLEYHIIHNLSQSFYHHISNIPKNFMKLNTSKFKNFKLSYFFV